MISDVLSDAVDEIQRYQREQSETCAELRDDLEALKWAMERLRVYFDTGPGCPGIEKHRLAAVQAISAAINGVRDTVRALDRAMGDVCAQCTATENLRHAVECERHGQFYSFCAAHLRAAGDAMCGACRVESEAWASSGTSEMRH